MATFFMFGKYTSEAAKRISAERTEKAREAIEKLGGRVREIYVLLGEYDLVIIADGGPDVRSPSLSSLPCFSCMNPTRPVSYLAEGDTARFREVSWHCACEARLDVRCCAACRRISSRD